MASTSKEEKVSSKTTKKDNELNRNMKKENQAVVRVKVGAEAELPFIEKFIFLYIRIFLRWQHTKFIYFRWVSILVCFSIFTMPNSS